MAGAIALHGGAGARRGANCQIQLEHMEALLRRGKRLLEDGATALDVAAALVADMEDSGLYIAGRGATPNRQGHCEMDASVMDGQTQRAGAVGALAGFQNPVKVARLIMERTPHAALVGSGAAAFADDCACVRIEDPTSWYRSAGQDEANHAQGAGTVGCCVLDAAGGLAAASSTAGLFDKMQGRISDTATIGAGIWCDRNVAVCCTGQGDYFIRAAAAARLAALARTGRRLDQCAFNCLDEVTRLGGWGGLIALSAQGVIAQECRKYGMKRGWLSLGGHISVSVLDPV